MSTGTPVTPHSVTSLKNATATPVGDQDSVQSGYRSACGVIAAAGKMTGPSYSWGLGRGQAADAPSPCGELLTPACLSPQWCSVPVWLPSPCSCCPGSVCGGACTRWGC